MIAVSVITISSGAFAQTGYASFYGNGEKLARHTANGEVFNPMAITAAHKTMKFGTKVKVTNLTNGKSVIVRINDRGPFIKGRIIDLSKGAAGKIGMIKSGTAKVRLEIVGSDRKAPKRSTKKRGSTR